MLNLSLAVTQSSSKERRALEQARDHAAKRGVLIVAAAGNQAQSAAPSSPAIPGSLRSPLATCEAGPGRANRFAFMQAHARGRCTVTPPLLNAWAAYQFLLATRSRR